MNDEESKSRPHLTAKLTNSKKGVIFIIPIPELGVSLNYMTSAAFIRGLVDGAMRKDMIACSFIGTSQMESFMNKDEKELLGAGKMALLRQVEGDPFSPKAQRERESQRVKITDDW